MKLNLGCGDRPIPGFINIDAKNMEGLDIISDIRTLPMFESDSIDLIYASHVIAYFDPREVSLVIDEWKRVIKSGGILRISTPNLESLIKIYKITGDINKIIGPLYGRMMLGKESIYHKQVFDRTSLVRLLTNCGFSSIAEWDWRETEHSNYDDYSQAFFPHMDKDNGLQVSLNLEAKK